MLFKKSARIILPFLSSVILCKAVTVSAQTINNIPVRIAAQNQVKPKAVALGTDIFSVWISQGSKSDKIEYIKILSSGMPDSASLGEMSNVDGSIVKFQVASDSPDHFFIAWQVFSQNQYRIKVQKIDKNGQVLWTNPATLSGHNLNYRKPALTTDFKDGCYVVWQQSNQADGDNPADIDLYGQHLDADGKNMWGTKAKIINRTGQQILGDIVATSQALGVVWQDKESRDVRLGAYDVDSGNALAGESGIAPGSGFTLYNPKIIQVKASATNVSDAVIVVWEEDGIFGSNKNINAQKIDLQGNLQWGSGVQISNNSTDPRQPQIVSDEKSGVIIVWQEHGGNAPGIYAQRLNSNGTRQWGNKGTKLADSSAVDAPVSIDHDGKQGVYLAWSELVDGGMAVLGQYFDKSKNPKWPKSGLLIAQHENSQTLPFAKTMGNRLFVTWQDDRAVDDDIYAQFVLKSGELDNVDPVIYSTPVTQAFVGVDYSYQVIAADVDQDLPLVYTLTNGPAWLSVDSTGLISGVPVIEAATPLNITVKVSDARGGSVLQDYKITVGSNNQPPQFTSIPPGEALEDSLYQYFPIAEDTDGDSIKISEISTPRWMKFDSTAGLLSGIPLNEDVGDTVVVIRAIDSKGAYADQKFDLTILNTNDAPVITSVNPPLFIQEGSLYSFQVSAEDVDAGDQLVYALEKAPAWLEIDSGTGLLAGTPSSQDIGADSVVITVKDLAGAADSLEFVLTVSNTNDAPKFVSIPITQAFVNVQYQYPVKAVDPDSGDSVFLSLVKAPTWLVLQDDILQGIPPESANKTQNDVVLQATDNAGLFAEQAFQIEVTDKPDTVAPAQMVAPAVQNNGWTAIDSIFVRWNNPQDEGSAITTLLVKYLESPMDSLDYDEQYPISLDGETALATIRPNIEGAVPFYCWLADAAGNADFTTAVQLMYKFDQSKPAKAIPIFPNAWARADTLVFRWIAAADTVSAIENYIIHLDVGESMVLPVTEYAQTGDTLKAEFPISLDGKLFSWSIEAVDSAGNTVTSAPLFFTVDAVKPFLQHGFIQNASASENLQFVAHVTDGISGVGRVALKYRTPGQIYTEVQMTGSGENSESFTYALPSASISSTGLEYTIYADDQAGNRAWLEEPNTGLNYKSIAITSEAVAGPKTLKNEYQLMSVPYDFSETAALSFFESAFRKYDDTEWRLLRYLNGVYLEINAAGFANLQPGDGFWLVTRTAKSWQTASVKSVPSDMVYEISLQPGWNIIGCPWAWSVPESQLNIPQNVENALWQWDNGYSLASGGLQPWRGYFINNTGEQVEKLLIDVTDKTPLTKIQHRPLLADANWLLRLSVSNGKFQDQSNIFGIARKSRIVSEPPKFSKAPRLYFNEKGTQQQIAVSIREKSDSSRKWQFIVDNLQPGAVNFSLSQLQPLPDSMTVYLFDQTAGIQRKIDAETPYRFLVTEANASRKFVISVGSDKQQQHNLIPQKLALEPVWPNPFHISRQNQMKIRFSLPKASRVELAIFNILGQKIWQIVPGSTFDAGKNAVLWNGRTASGRWATSGIYFVRLLDGKNVTQAKFVFVR